MPFKTLRLKRTNTFYPTAGSRRNLTGLLKNLTLTHDALEDILELEDADFAAGKQGVEPRELEALITAARKADVLPDSELTRIYFHILRYGGLPRIESQSELDILLQAYQRLNQQLHRGYPAIALQPLMGLMLFGFYGNWRDDKGNNNDNSHNQLSLSLVEYQRRLNAWHQANRYVAIPNMLEKVARFQQFSQDSTLVAHILQVLRTCGYQHHNYNPDHPEGYFTTYRPFWGLVFMVLLNRDYASQLVEDIRQLEGKLPHFAQHWGILQRFIEATQC